MITSPRQTGKTTLLNHYVKSFVQSNPDSKAFVLSENIFASKLLKDLNDNPNIVVGYNYPRGQLFDLIAIDNLEYVNQERLYDVFLIALSWGTRLCITAGLDYQEKLDPQVAKMLDACIVASAKSDKYYSTTN